MGALTVEMFKPHIGEAFEAVFDDGTIRFELAEAMVRPSSRPGPRTPFSLIFLGPVDVIFPQQIYPLEHPILGLCEIFLVPIGTEGERGRYQAVFN